VAVFEGSCCEKEEISAENLVMDNVLCPITALLLPAMEEEVVATSEASYVCWSCPALSGNVVQQYGILVPA